MLLAAILHECQNYLGGGAVWEEALMVARATFYKDPKSTSGIDNDRL